MEKLIAYNISGQTVGINIASWNNDELHGNDAFCVIHTDVIPSGYTDISSIENWSRFGLSCSNDYSVVKFAIKNLCDSIGWSGLTNNEKDLSIEYYSYPDTTTAIIYLMTNKGMSQQEAQQFLVEEWHHHHLRTINAYTQRWHYAKYTVLLFLSRADGTDLFNTVKSLVDLYIELAVLGIDWGEYDNGLDDYIWSKNGFTGQGLEENNYTLLQGDWTTFKQALTNVLVHGIYEIYLDLE